MTFWLIAACVLVLPVVGCMNGSAADGWQTIPPIPKCPVFVQVASEAGDREVCLSVFGEVVDVSDYETRLAREEGRP